jgi:hypothetical protein
MPRQLEAADRQLYDFIAALVKTEVNKHDCLRAASPRGTGAIERSLVKRISGQALNSKLTQEQIAAKIFKAVDKLVIRHSKPDDPQTDIDRAGPFNMLPQFKRQPSRVRGQTLQYGLNPEKYLEATDYQKRDEVVVIEPPPPAAKPVTLDNLGADFFDDARERGLKVVVNTTLGLGITSRRILETAAQMAEEMAQARILDPLRRKSRAKQPGLPEWSAVAVRLGEKPATVRKSVQRLRAFPAFKLFSQISAQERA